ncbi:MAG: DinB family protein [Gemmatimonadaceae bacterium]
MSVFMTPEAFLDHWQGHRRLTRRVIEAFPADQLFSFSIGGMRPFGVLACEFISMTMPMVNGLVTGEWTGFEMSGYNSKETVLAKWDEDTAALNAAWSKIAPSKFAEQMMAFGQFPGTGQSLLMYVVDNEIHHRGQGYVYLRALGIAPPAFYER